MAATSPASDAVSLLIDDEQDSSHNVESPGLGIRNVFRSVEYEIARDHEACSGCLDIRKFLKLRSWYFPNECYRLKLPVLIHNSDTCWFCRFLCRVMARFFDEEQFKDCQEGKIPMDICHARGLWEEDLMITASPDSPASSHLFALPYKTRAQRARPRDPTRENSVTDIFITIDDRKDTKVRKLGKLISDSVQQHETYFGMIRDLLALCEGRHKLCMVSVTEQPPLPTDFTLIDTLDRVLVPYTYSKPYIALSYVWGERCLERDWIDDGKLVKLGELVQRIYERKTLPVNLPQTIEDAICVTQRISQRYLWVDLLCINQTELDSRNDSISKMDAVFSRAFLTICVLQGRSMFSGIPGVSQTHEGRHQILTETESMRYMASNLTDLGGVIYTSDWSQRGWTFQEGVLSGRRLCFHTSGVFLHCKEEILHDILESVDDDERVKTPWRNSDQVQYVSLWISPEARAWDFGIYARMVWTYSPRALTLSADAHDAIAGVLGRMTRSMNMSFIGGLPEGDFFNALLWDYESEVIIPRRPQFPSWSWLGWEGSKVYEIWVFDRIKERSDNSKLTEEVNGIQSIRTESAIYFDIVRIQSAASFTFTHTTRDGSNATLRIKTQRALFQVLWRPVYGRPKRVYWQIVQSNGDPIPFEPFLCKKSLARRWEEYVTVAVHQEVSDQLSQSQFPQLEFVLLQRWTYNETSHTPQIFECESFKHVKDHSIPKINPPFTDHVWLMAVASQGDGTFERLDVIRMPARFWDEANPEAVSVDVV